MSHPASLTRLSIATAVANGKKIVERIIRSKGEERLRLWHLIQKLIWALRLWNLPDCIDSYFVNTALNFKRQSCAVWKIRVESIDENSIVTTALLFKNEHEFNRFKAFFRHLVCNWFEKLKVQKLYGNNTGFLVSHPAPALLYFYPNTSSMSTEISGCSKHEESNATKVMKVLKEAMRDDFRLKFLSENKLDTTTCIPKESKVEDLKDEASGFDAFIKRPDLHQEGDKDFILTEVFLCFDKISSTFLKRPEQCSSSSLMYPQATANVKNKETQTAPNSEELKIKNDRLKQTIQSLQEEIERRKADYRKVVSELESRNNELTMEIASLRSQMESKEEEIGETLLELGRVSVEVTRLTNEKKRELTLAKTFKSRNKPTISVFTQTFEPSTSSQPSVVTHGTGAEGGAGNSNNQTHERDEDGNSENSSAVVSTQESLEVSSHAEGASLTNMPTNAVERSLYNNYKLLLLALADQLLSSDVNKLKAWASTAFAADNSLGINEVFRYLDEKKVIGPSDLNKLKDFFEKILRIDLVYLIDRFLMGDYTPLREMYSRNISRDGSQRTDRARNSLSGSRSHSPLASGNERQLPEDASSTGPRHDAGAGLAVKRRGFLATRHRESSNEVENETNIPHHAARVADRRSGSPKHDTGTKTTDDGNHESGDDDDDDDNDDDDDDNDDDDDDHHHQWLCNHYKRHCHVKFACCNKYWPCHRCHNYKSNCGEKKLKSRDTKFLKCVRCGEEQQFSSRAQFCRKCHLKFAKYFCAICKHLTGTDDTPYHCEKCGICRIHKHRSFHCDICGVCLDVQLRDNHKCRAGSAHDECCICLEDAFTGCQILPCSHKVHKECASHMIRSGITRCPICRESFAHKLEKKNTPDPKKPHGK